MREASSRGGSVWRSTFANQALAALAALAALLATPAAAQVTVNQILFPSNIGRTLDATVTIDWTRTSTSAAVITTPLPPQLSANPPAPPAGCTFIASPAAIECTVPAGAVASTGQITFNVRGATLGAFGLVATATGGSNASNTGAVRSSGELTVLKTKSPSGNLLAGQTTTFTLQPQLAAGADDLPTGATLTLIDQLPGTATDFSVSAINAGIASCSDVATANSVARTVTCTFTGPLTVAQINAASVVITGSPGTNGNFANVGSVLANQPGYFDRDPNNNLANVPYTVDPASDVQALGSFPATPVATGSAQTLRLQYRNNGPMNLPGGGTVATTIPAGFTVSTLPAGCSIATTGTPLLAPEVLTCTASAIATGVTQSFDIALTMPAVAASGNFTITVTPPATFGDAVTGNNQVDVPYSVVLPYADLRLNKSKSPGSGPIAQGTTITTTLTVINDAASPATASYGPTTPLRVVDYLRPEEIAGDAVSAVTAGWTCSVASVTDPSDPTGPRTRRVSCTTTGSGTLSAGASASVSFSHSVQTPLSAPVALVNRACTGETALSELGLTAADGPQPAGSGQTSNDCATAGASLVGTPVVSGNAAVGIVKESSINGTTFVDDPATPPTLPAVDPTQFWRITITTPAGGVQDTIPTLVLSDPLPGILNVGSPGAPAPGYQTPAITVSTNVGAGSASGSCPNLAAGASNLSCTFTNVAPGTTITITYSVSRPFAAGLLLNTATLTSPNAILSGTTSDAAAITVLPRIDVATTTKVVTPGTPRIGQTLQFTITAQNLGPDTVAAAGDFKIIDDLNTTVGPAAVAYGDIQASGTDMSCSVVGSALPDEPALAAGSQRVRCVSTTAVPRYSNRTVQISARVLKPGTLPPSGTVYAGQVNTVRVDIPDALCEWKTETDTGAAVSGACNDAASDSNNSRSATYDVLVPQIDLQQRKTRVLPAGQTTFAIGQPLRYRFRIQNNGPSRAEGVTMVDRLTVPAGFTLAGATPLNVNGTAAEAGYTLDTSKTASVSCSQPAANADITCLLSSTAASNFLDASREVNFEIEMAQTGTAVVPVSFRNEVLVCADETAGYESAGACDRNAPSNNNLAAVNETVFPRVDLALTKTRVTASPVSINQPVQYQLVARNLGPNATQQVRVVDVLPANFELVTSGAQAPALSLGSFVTQAPSTASGATLACSASPATITTPGQQQTITCIVNAQPGPLGSGAFPGSNDAANTLTLTLHARAKEGLFTGPYAADQSNSASVQPGLDGSGNPLSTDTTPGNNTATAAVQVQRASLAGRVFNDRNGNGAQDGTAPAQDEGIGGVTITLTGTDAYGNAVSRTATTVNTVGATRGDYLFDHLPPGNYTITETQPAGFVNSVGTPPAAVPDANYQPSPTPTTSRWTSIALPAGTAGASYLFPEQLPPGTISGVVYVDRDGNNSFGNGDAPIAGVSVGLYPAGTVCPASGPLPGGALATRSTDLAGAYSFNGTSGTSYVICQQQPAGHADAAPNPGPAGSTPRANQIDISNLPIEGSAGNNFPERLGRIAGTVFADFSPGSPANSNNGVQNSGEPGIGSSVAGAGVPVTLAGTPSAGPGAGTPIAPRTVTTAADGRYAFDDLMPGTYTLTQGVIPPTLGLFSDGINTAGPVVTGTPGSAGAVGDNAIRNIVLDAGGQSPGNNFAELPQLSITGRVYADRNRNGQLDGGEVGLGGILVTLRSGGTSCSDGVALGTTVTSADGSFVFPGGSVPASALSAGQAYRICQSQPAAYLDGTTLPGVGGSSPRGNEIVIASLPVGSSSNHLFGEWAASLSGWVYVDEGGGTRTNNGLRDAGEPGIGGVPIRLSFEQVSLPDIITTTDPDGRYRFDDLPAGRYTVTEGALPVGDTRYISGRTTVGTIDGVPVGRAGDDQIRAITLAAGAAGVDYNFGELLQPPPTPFIGGLVFVDGNRDGRFGPEDRSRIEGVTVRLVLGRSCSGSEIARTLTNAFGEYAFSGNTISDPRLVVGGVYSVCQEQPPAYRDGPTVPGPDGSSPAPNHIVVSLQSMGSLANNFGEWGARLSGSVYLDIDNNGAFEPARGDRGIGQVTVTLSGPSLAQPRQASTMADGSFAFDDLPAGVYTLTEQTEQPLAEIGVVRVRTLDGRSTAGGSGGTASAVGSLPSTISGIALGAGEDSRNHLFGEVLPARIEGRVWRDDNRDGRIDGVEPGLPGVTIELRGSDDLGRAVALVTSTAADGRWSFDTLRPGRYDVVEPRQPEGTRNGTTVAGTLGGSATPIETTPSAIRGIVLTPNAASTGNLFGEVPASAAIEGRVWLDRDDNGRIDAGEPGIAGVPIELNGTDSSGQPVLRSTRSDGEGRWRFDDLAPGTYRVVEPQQPPATGNGQTVAGTGGGTATSPATLPSAIDGIRVDAGQTARDNHFGERPLGAIAGRVWLDADADGRIGSSERGIAGVVIELRGLDSAGQTVARSTITDAQGRYRFDDLPPGSYAITQPTQPAGTLNGATVPGSSGGVATPVLSTPSVISSVPLALGQVSEDNDFGELPPASLSGRVWLDRNDNGRIDIGEDGIGGVPVQLTGNFRDGNGPLQTIVLTTITAADGSYRFDNLRPGRYLVTEPTQPPGTDNGRTVAGSVGGVATAVTQLPSAIDRIELPAGTDATQYDFGEIPQAPDLRVSKAAQGSRFVVGRQAQYLLSVRNVGSAATTGAYTVVDRLPAGITLAGTPAGTGWRCSGDAGAATFSCSSSVVLAPGALNPAPISATVNVADAAADASPARNRVLVEGGGEPAQAAPSAAERAAVDGGDPSPLRLCVAAANDNACQTATDVVRTAALSGTAWLDSGNRLRQLDGGDQRLPGWRVEVIDPGSGQVVATSITGSDGSYRITGLEPDLPFFVRFRDADSDTIFGTPVNGEAGSPAAPCSSSGAPSSCVDRSTAPQLRVVLAPGQELRQQSLPVSPGGVVYDAISREPVAGATVTLAPAGSCPGWDPASQIAAASSSGFSIRGNTISTRTGRNGWYQFLFLAAAPARCTFTLTVTPPPSHVAPSTLIVAAPALGNPGAAGGIVAVQPQPGAPTAPVGPATVHHLTLDLGSNTPEVVNNHLPLDPALPAAIQLRKTGDRAVAEIGDSIRYSITVRVASGALPRQVSVVDRLPAGFSFVAGTASVDGRPVADPMRGPGSSWVFQLGAMPAAGQMTLTYRARVGVGAAEGDGINTAIAHGCALPAGCLQPGTLQPVVASRASNEGRFRVRVQGGVFGGEACVLGKVYVDCNGNHVQDREELGIPGVRLVMQDGTTLISDSEGKYSMCGVAPKSHVIRIDEYTLPRGSRLTTSSNRNLGDAGSLWLDVKRGELHRADFVIGSCSNTVLEQVKARRAQGEVRAPETERAGRPALRLDSKAHGRSTLSSPAEGSDGANQQTPKPRSTEGQPPGKAPARDERHVPTGNLPMNQPPPTGRRPGDAPDAPPTQEGGRDGTR